MATYVAKLEIRFESKTEIPDMLVKGNSDIIENFIENLPPLDEDSENLTGSIEIYRELPSE